MKGPGRHILVWFMVLLMANSQLKAENGYDLWLRYPLIKETVVRNAYINHFTTIRMEGQSPTLLAARKELLSGLEGLTGRRFTVNNKTPFRVAPGLVIGNVVKDKGIAQLVTAHQLQACGTEGFVINTTKQGPIRIVIAANSDIGVLYGVFHFLQLMQTKKSLDNLHIVSAPRLKLRLLNHWDNLNRTVERGYAGFSIWNWHTLPSYIDQRYIDYARANASIGINGTVLTNVNANATILTPAYLLKVKALADVFRPYGIRVYLTARFSAPIESGGLKTADPLNAEVRNWWKEKAKEIYALIPDFGGFLVKANSEGQPGPQDYKRTHADGANMLADAVAPFNGIVIWRAFVYAAENPVDRHKQAYDDFMPLDGKFNTNVMVQVKNGAIDFMPREPFHPLFGTMPKTPLMMEFQVTQEYLGQSTNLVYLAPLFKEVLDSDTRSKGKGSTVANIIAGRLDGHTLNGMAGVANIGNDINWCGHPFAQANWYALGRLAWDHSLSSEQIAEEWIRMTFTNDNRFVQPVLKLMLGSRETLVNYMNPLGLHHIMGTGHHYGPAPWVNDQRRPEWNPVYYHKADSFGIGFDRTSSGSNALAQYQPEVRNQWDPVGQCDEKYLLWFHHVSWNHPMKNGRSLWNELCYRYYDGAAAVKKMQAQWEETRGQIDQERYEQVRQLLAIQYNEATWWRDACLLYFQTFSKQPLPDGFERPAQSLDYYKQLRFPYAPGN
jgi:alpha-glucuronidase